MATSPLRNLGLPNVASSKCFGKGTTSTKYYLSAIVDKLMNHMIYFSSSAIPQIQTLDAHHVREIP